MWADLKFDCNRNVPTENLFNYKEYLQPLQQKTPSEEKYDSCFAEHLAVTLRRVKMFKNLFCDKKPFFLKKIEVIDNLKDEEAERQRIIFEQL